MALPLIRLLQATLHRAPTRTRMPFRFGIATIDAAPFGVAAPVPLDGFEVVPL